MLPLRPLNRFHKVPRDRGTVEFSRENVIEWKLTLFMNTRLIDSHLKNSLRPQNNNIRDGIKTLPTLDVCVGVCVWGGQRGTDYLKSWSHCVKVCWFLPINSFLTRQTLNYKRLLFAVIRLFEVPNH